MSTHPTPDSLHLVIFGATGDLTRHKLLPALFSLFAAGHLPEDLLITAFTRRDLTDEDYREIARECLDDTHPDAVESVREEFLRRIVYLQGNFKEQEDFGKLKAHVAKNEKALTLFYIATSPAWYKTIFARMETAGLHELESANHHICIEKPFGKDLQTARELDRTLCGLFAEEQIFRIDHYLAKQALQNILTFRFTNRLFADSWDSEAIESVSLRFFEDDDVADRGGFYDQTGALRDVGQNHLLQLLAAVAMENPGDLSAESVRSARAAVLEDLAIISENEICDKTLRAQYAGYRETAAVADDSTTETYFELMTEIDNERWAGVPFYLASGKALGEKRVEIEITFRAVLPCVCGATEPHGHKNVVRIELAPERKIAMEVWAREDELTFAIGKREATLDLATSDDDGFSDAYEKILYDAICGDQLLFTTGREVAAAWRFITPILERWGECELHEYEPAASGPDASLQVGE